MWEMLGNVALFAAAIPAVLFVAVYSTTKWEKTAYGRQQMALRASLAAILTMATTRVIFEDSRVWIIARLVVFFSIIPVLWWGLVLLLRTQREYRGKRMTTPAQQREEDAR